MATTLGQLAKLVGGEVLGDGEIEIHGAASLDDARPGEITLLDNAERVARLLHSPAAAAVVPRNAAPENMPALTVDNVHQAFRLIVAHFRPAREQRRGGVSPAAYVAPSAKIAEDVEIHPGATIGEDVEIGSGATIHSGTRILAGCKLAEGVTVMPNAVIYEDTQIGPRTLIHACAVIGAYGFGYETVSGRHQRGAQLGWVEIGADVEIGAGTTVDRGTYGPTTIGEGTKIDNLVQIAHNCRIGRHNLICSQVGIAGSVTSGDYVVMAGQVGVRDHVTIGDQAILGAMAGITNDVPAGACMIGIPATPQRDQKVKQAALAKLPEMRQEFKALKRTVEQLVAKKIDDPSSAAA